MRDDVIYWAKVKQDAKLPVKRIEDAGYDLYPCFEEDYIIIEPHTCKMISLGVASAFSHRRVVLLKERGSTGTKNIAQRSGVIDSGFRGEYMCPVSNLNEVPLVIVKEHVNKEQFPDNTLFYPYEKAICQALILTLPEMDTQEVSYEALLELKSERMKGKLGSSGK